MELGVHTTWGLQTHRMRAATSNPRLACFPAEPRELLRKPTSTNHFSCETKPTCHPVSSPTSPTLKMGQLRLRKEKGLAQGHNSKSVAEPGQTLRADLPAPIKFPVLYVNPPSPLSLSRPEHAPQPETHQLSPQGRSCPAAAGYSTVAHLGALNPELGGSKNPLQRELLSMLGLAPSSL